MKNNEAFSKEVMEAFKYAFSQPGALTAAINYHRNMFKVREKLTNSDRYSGKVEKPVLIIWVCCTLIRNSVALLLWGWYL